MKFTDFYKAWIFLQEHPILHAGHSSFFRELLDIDVEKYNPNTNKVDDVEEKNTQIEVRLECSVFDENSNKEERYKSLTSSKTKDCCHRRDIELDCNGKTFEEAIIKLANLVVKKYGNKAYQYQPIRSQTS